MQNNDQVSELIVRALNDSSLVQSFSGVRTRFGAGPDISAENSLLAQAYGFAYARRILANMPTAKLIVGRDPRPTGEALSQALARGFLAGATNVGCRVKIYDLGIITTPLIETAVRALKTSGGVMVTASHNPLSDNGFKFLTGVQGVDASDPNDAPPGALISAPVMGSVVEEVYRISQGEMSEFAESIGKIDDKEFERVFGTGEDHKHRIKAERAYLDFLGEEWGIQPHCLKPLVLGPALLDPNGGAACGIAARVLEHFGVRAIEVNAELTYPEHAIDTDGIDPASGRHTLLRVARAAARHGARFGIAFDYDADRGNIVLPGHDDSVIIPPQTVATMNIALALSYREIIRRKSNGKLAVVVSEATSGASDKVALLFGAEVFTVETGEINVVTKMHQLRCQGYEVPVGVEGANGGTIFGEATCRDGLQTALCAALADEQPNLSRQWLRILSRNGKRFESSDTLRLPEILAGVPTHFNRMLRFESAPISHAEIKARIERYFAETVWPSISDKFTSYRFANYEGTQTVEKRTGDETGGWRVILEDDDDRAFIFVRGSRTEAGVWRLIVDDPNPSRGAELVLIARDMLDTASRNA